MSTSPPADNETREKSAYPRPHLMGIRHHGPGSARSVRNALAGLQPQIVLIEGPPDGQELLAWTGDEGLVPPAAMLIYRPKKPSQAVYYPFAHFSPEWQAVQGARRLGVPVRFIDLSQATQFALNGRKAPDPPESEEEPAPGSDVETPLAPVEQDPLAWIAAASGYPDSERWWESQVEERRDSSQLFSAISDLMVSLRTESEKETAARKKPSRRKRPSTEVLREAAMRQAIRAAYDEGFSRVAVVCGAWHTPALMDLEDLEGDRDLLAKLPSTDVAATWVPWTYGRLAYRSGYGAGISSPGWYHHLWDAQAGGTTQLAASWLTRTAQLMREEGLTVSSAHIIEAVRLVEALAALRQRPAPGLEELIEATQSVFCFGDSLPIALVREKLLVGERLGSVPEGVPTVPLQADLSRLQKRLRLKPQAGARDLELDLRKPTGVGRSQLLHRLTLLGIPWGVPLPTRPGRGTFRENWSLEWRPEFAVSVIEASVWGNSVADAADARARQRALAAQNLADLTDHVQTLLLAELPAALSATLDRIEEMAALAGDVQDLMRAFPPLARVLRYGDVRGTDVKLITDVVEGLIVRTCIGLPHACRGIAEEEAEKIFALLNQMHQGVTLLQAETEGRSVQGAQEHLEGWLSVLGDVAQSEQTHPLLAGRACRLLRDMELHDGAETARQLGVALSAASNPLKAAHWIDGLLRDSGTILIYDRQLWDPIDRWVSALPSDRFVETLPMLRRTFATFTQPERRRLGELAAGRDGQAAAAGPAQGFDSARAELALPTIAQLLGLPEEETDGS